MAIVQADHRRPGMPKAGREARHTDDRARRSLQVPGPLWKTWLGGDAERLASGAHMFEDRASAGACAAGPIAADPSNNPEPPEVDVRGRMGEITRAPLPGRRAVAE